MDDAVFESPPLMVIHRLFQDSKGTLRQPFIGPGHGRFGVDVVFVGQIAGKIGRTERDHFAVVKGLDAFHIGVIHFLAAVDRDAVESQGPRPVAVVDVGLDERFVRRLEDGIVFSPESRRRRDLGMEQPERDVHGLDGFDAVVGRKGPGQEPAPLVKLFQRRHGFFFGLLEGNDVVGLEHPGKAAGNEGRVATVTTFRGHGILVADDFSTAR